MPVTGSPHRMSITEATRRGVSGLVADVVDTDIVLERHGKAVAAVVGIDRIEALEEARADLRDLALVVARAGADTGERVSLDTVLGTFGLTRKQLDALPDED